MLGNALHRADRIQGQNYTFIRGGDPILGSPVSHLSFGRQELNVAGQVAFLYHPANVQQGSALAKLPGLPGDFNLDNAVDPADHVFWRKGASFASTPENYNLWRTNFGRTAARGAAYVDSSAAPKPSSPLWIIALAAARARMRRRRHPV